MQKGVEFVGRYVPCTPDPYRLQLTGLLAVNFPLQNGTLVATTSRYTADDYNRAGAALQEQVSSAERC